MRPNIEWAMSIAAFERDWPPPLFENGIYYIGPRHSPKGFGTAITADAAAWQHHEIRKPHALASASVVWC